MSDENLSIEIINAETIINKVLTKTEIYTMTINRLVKIMQFNAANYTFFDNYINDLSHYA